MWQLHWWLAQGCGKTIIVQNHRGEKREHFKTAMHSPTTTTIFINLRAERCWGACVLIAVTGCHSLWQVQHYSWSHENVVHTSGYCKVDELLKWLIMISDALSIMSRERGFNLTANITLQQLQPIKGVFHTSFVIWQLLLSKALKMRNKCSL